MTLPRVSRTLGQRLSTGHHLLVSRQHAIKPAGRVLYTSRSVSQINSSSSKAIPKTKTNQRLIAVGSICLFTALVGEGIFWTAIKADSKPKNGALASGDATLTLNDLEKTDAATSISHRTAGRIYDTLNQDQATHVLREHETTAIVPLSPNSGVLRYDNTHIACNDPIEDDHVEAVVPKPAVDDVQSPGQWVFWGIFDGHSGWATSAKLRQSLVARVYSSLAGLYKSAGPSPDPTEVDQAIKAGFLELDREIVWSHIDEVLKADSKALATKLLAPALSGSCALLALYDTNTQLLRVACTGDSRAVLGRRVDAATWSATPLSSDQTGANPDEAARIRAEHPAEEKDCVKNGRVLGYEPSRVFGDANLKWPRKLSLTLREKFYAKYPSEKVLTPPYATAEPVVITTKIQPEKGDFVVMGCDGLWEMLSNEEVVGLVAGWMDKNPSRSGSYIPVDLITHQEKEARGWFANLFLPSQPATAMPAVEPGPNSEHVFGSKPNRPAQWQIVPTTTGGGGNGSGRRQRHFVLQDTNAATHLARNGLGGSDHDLLSSLLVLGGKNARRFRDDLTITVIFFGYES